MHKISMPNFLKITNFRILSIVNIRFFSQKNNSNLLKVLKTMPKEAKHIPEAQNQRKKIKEKYAKYVPGKVALQVLGSGAEGAPRALYLFSDQSRYLFNCGEGTQRLAHEHKMKLAKLEHIFITQPVWKNIGGLPGTALTIQDVGVPQITLHGPEGLEELFVATKRFVVIRDLEIKMAICSEEATFEDNVISVRYVPITRDICKNEILGDPDANSETKEDLYEDETDYYAHEKSGKRAKPRTVSPDSQHKLQGTKEKGVSMCYICKLQPRPGALNLDKCVKMGVTPGPLLGKLKGGEDIVLPNGNTVCSKDVCEPDDPGPVFIVVDCPSEEYLDSLTTNPKFHHHQSTATKDDDLACIVIHFTPSKILNTKKYRDWVDKFSPSTQHLILNDKNTCMGSLSVHRIQYKLNMLNEEIFPLLGDKGTEIVDEGSNTPQHKRMRCDGLTNENLPIEKLSVKSRPDSPLDNLIYANTFCTFHLRPKKGLDSSLELKIVPSQYIDETINIDQFPDVLQQLKQKWNHSKKDLITKGIRPYPKTLFLGTGSCIPNKTRNTSGILLETGEDKNILMDCGEGTYGQIVRFFGTEKAHEVLSNINAVYISHLHADHHIGLIGLLQGRKKALEYLGLEKEPLYLFAPKQILAWLQFYDSCFESIRNEYILIPNTELLMKNTEEKNTFSESLCQTFSNLDMENITTCYVKHCPNAFGVALKHKTGYKITYSGDTMPTGNLIDLGKDSDLLIHEATMEDELADEAVIKMHSTTSQAIEVGKQMNARHILLTHFSQRYAKLPRFNDNFAENVGIAFDNMQIKLDELPLVPNLYPALKLMFAEHVEELEHKAVKRQLKIERKRDSSVEKIKIKQK